MRMYDIIEKKRDGNALSNEEIDFFVHGFVAGRIPDYQMSALLMAIFFSGMDARETAHLTMAMAQSGEMLDLSSIPGIKVDKHSTGGVGDKATLVCVPLAAAVGVPVAKISGRGLGHTGGTVDKLESIPGVWVAPSRERFLEIARTVGCVVVGQSGNLDPADKLFYALRDVTATIDSMPLIASSVMSKKIAAGAERILLEVTCGNGAFMKSIDDAVELARQMVEIGEHVGRTTVALVTDMNQPLGRCVGNTLEVAEVCDVLQGRGPADITEVGCELAANMALLAEKGTLEECRAMVRASIADGTAFAKFRAMVEALGGDARMIDDPALLPQAACSREVRAARGGFVYEMDTERVGTASAVLGAGRITKEDEIDYTAGIRLARKTGDAVAEGDVLATIYAAREDLLDEGERVLLGAYDIRDDAPVPRPHFHARVSRDGIE